MRKSSGGEQRKDNPQQTEGFLKNVEDKIYQAGKAIGDTVTQAKDKVTHALGMENVGEKHKGESKKAGEEKEPEASENVEDEVFSEKENEIIGFQEDAISSLERPFEEKPHDTGYVNLKGTGFEKEIAERKSQ